MPPPEELNSRDRWARLRLLIIGQLLAAPPARGELKQRLIELSRQTWRHPIRGGEVRFGVSTLERWLALARRSPDPATIQILVALKPLYDAVGIERIQACIGEAVSGHGKAAIEELAGQTAALLNGQSIEPRFFQRQIAFNCLPRIDVLLDNGYTENEMEVVWATRRILADDAIQVNPTAYLMPVFFGYCTVLQVETSRPLDAVGARRLLERAPGVVVMDGRKAGDFPTPIGAVGTDSVYVGRIRQDISTAQALNMWVVADNARKGSANNSVQIAEVLVKTYL